jgi:hypothetical protein
MPPVTTTADATTLPPGGDTSFGDTSDGGDDDCGCDFLCDPCSDRRCPDDPPDCNVVFECDPFAQDCPADEKCMPWANDGGSRWNATRCSPIDPQASGLGEACLVEGSNVSGIDQCALGLMCFDVDPPTNTGVCAAMCGGSEASPTCAEGTTCLIANGGALSLCLPDCDPLGTPCDDGHGCFPGVAAGEFVCLPAPSEQIVSAGTCAYAGGCEPGTVCVDGTQLPACDDPEGCCTRWCDAAAPVDACTDGTTCQSFFLADPPPGFETLGVCLIP